MSDLTATECAVLGLLARGENSGYDLHKTMDGLVFWTPARAQIYAVLAKCVERGLASARHVPQSDRPDKQLYRITAAGERALQAAVERGLSARFVVKDPVLLEVFLGSLAPVEALLEKIELRRQLAQARMEQLEELALELDEREGEDVFTYITVLAALERTHATVRWAGEARRLLERRARRSSAEVARDSERGA
jgi:DNA-binding PadR family transcriptional regulator